MRERRGPIVWFIALGSWVLKRGFRRFVNHPLSSATPDDKPHPPAGLQWYSLCRTTHNSETTFEFAAPLAGRVQQGLGGIGPIGKTAKLRLRYFPTEDFGEFFCVNVSSRDNADDFASSCLTRYCSSYRSGTCSLSYYAVPVSK